jgi:Rrf2 family protein
VLPLPQTTEYALRAVLFIAERHPHPLRVHDVAEMVNAPENYLSKTLHQLTRAGVLVSTRGRLGGFRLAMEPSELTLERVIAVFNHHGPQRCLLGHGACGQSPRCTVHARWKPVAQTLREFFGSTTIADLVDQDGAGCSLLPVVDPAPLPAVS